MLHSDCFISLCSMRLRIYGHCDITMDLSLVCIQINNTVTFVIKNYEEKVNQNHINSKQSAFQIHGVTPCFASDGFGLIF